jgi:predicted dehydrogenase
MEAGVNMKFLIIGLGSMGKRRIRNLQYLNAGEIVGFDLRADRCREAEERYDVETYQDFEKAMKCNPDVFIISTPPDKHVEYALVALRNDKHFFMEASVLKDGLDELIALCHRKDVVVAPSCTMRFHPAIRLIKSLVAEHKIGKVLAFTYHTGQYLPNWHPWEDYRTYYVSRRETGACREIVPFELEWLTWILGKVENVSCLRGKLSNLEADIDDVYQLLLKFRNGALGNVLVDVISRVPHRVLRLVGEQGEILWDWNNKHVMVFNAVDKKWQQYPVDEGLPEQGYIVGEKMYIDEMAHFINAIKGEGKYGYSLIDDKEVLEILYAAETSSEKGRREFLT